MKDDRRLSLEIEYNLGVAYYQKAQYWAYGEAEKAFKQILDAIGDNPQAQFEIDLLALTHCGLVAIAAQRSTGRSATQEELWATGQKHYDKALELVSHDSEIYLQAQYAMALLLFLNRKDFLKARDLLRTVLERSPYHWRAYTVLGQMALAENRVQEAINYLKRATALAPDFEFAHYQLGHAYSHSKNVDLAIEAYTKAPTIAGARINLGRELALGKKDYAGAIEQFEEALALNARDADAYADIAWYLVEGNLTVDEVNRSRAITAAEEAVRLTGGEDWRKLGVLGRTYYECGRLEDARQTLWKLREIEPNAPHALYYLARIDFDDQNLEQARTHLVSIFNSEGNEEMDYWRRKASLLMSQIREKSS